MLQIELNKKEKNKELVLEAFDTLFNQRDYIAAEYYWSSNSIGTIGRPNIFGIVLTSRLVAKVFSSSLRTSPNAQV